LDKTVLQSSCYLILWVAEFSGRRTMNKWKKSAGKSLIGIESLLKQAGGRIE
jgi:hypothetical protein